MNSNANGAAMSTATPDWAKLRQSVRERLAELGYVGEEGWGWCPMHEQSGEHGPSFSVTADGDGRDFMHCFSKRCDQRELFEYVLRGIRENTLPVCSAKAPRSTGGGWGKGSYGARVSVWSIHNSEDYFTWCRYTARDDVPHETELYVYRDERGENVTAKQRWSDKHFLQLHWSEYGGWRLGLNGTTPPLYNSDLIAAKPDEPVWAVEGEKDADRLAALGLVATSTHGPDASNLYVLAGRAVIVVPDNDAAGRLEAASFARMSTTAGARDVRVVDSLGGDATGGKYGTGDGFDVSDFLDGGSTVARLEELAAGAEPVAQQEQVETSRTAAVERLQPMGTAVLDQPETPPAVWGRDKFIAWSCGQGTMIASHQGLGKSTIAQQLVLHRVEVRNGDFLGMPVTPIESGKKVLYLAMDRPMQIKQSLRRMLCEADRAVLDDRAVLWHGPLPFNLMENPLRFADWVQEICPDVGDVIVDSVKDLAAGVSKDEVGSAVNIAWQELIARNIELLLLHHQRKAEQGGKRVNALDDVYGSTWLTSGLGSVFALDGDPGAQVVTMKHLKPVMMQLDDTEIRHDHLTGTTTLHNASRVDLFDFVRNAGDVGVTAVEAAQAVIGVSGTTEVQKIRRELNKLVNKERVEKLPGIRTNQGAEPDRWRIRDEQRWAVQLDA